jgi:hypothetical protein
MNTETLIVFVIFVSAVITLVRLATHPVQEETRSMRSVALKSVFKDALESYRN